MVQELLAPETKMVEQTEKNETTSNTYDAHMAQDIHETAERDDRDSRQSSDEVLSIVLTADNHLGYSASGQQARKREEREQRQRRAFQQVTDFAIGQGVDLFVQAGDLFDTPVPEERDRGFVAERLAQLKQGNIPVLALGGVHDTPGASSASSTPSGGDAMVSPAPQLSYASLGALRYFAPGPRQSQPVEPVVPLMLTIRGMLVGICGLGVLAGQEGDPLASMNVDSSIERAAITLLLLHAPIEGFTNGSSLLDTRAMVRRSSIERQSDFRYILAGYHHNHHHIRVGQCDVIVAGATQHTGFHSAPVAAGEEGQAASPVGARSIAPTEEEHTPGFVFLGLARDGLRWCKHIEVDALRLRRLSISVNNLWSSAEETAFNPTERILEQLRPLCDTDTMVQLRLEGELTRRQYHQLDLNRVRRYGEEQCFALAIDDSDLSLLSEAEGAPGETGERFSPREELISLADEWIAAASDEQEKHALQATKDLLTALLSDSYRRATVDPRFIGGRAKRGDEA